MSLHLAVYAVLVFLGALCISTAGVVSSLLLAMAVAAGDPAGLASAYIALAPLQLTWARDVAPYSAAASALLVGVACVFRARRWALKTRAASATLSAGAFGVTGLVAAAVAPVGAAPGLASMFLMVVVGILAGFSVGAVVHPWLKRLSAAEVQ